MNNVDVIKEDVFLDCSGMLCPMPIVKTTKAMKELQSGQILKMVATDAAFPGVDADDGFDAQVVDVDDVHGAAWRWRAFPGRGGLECRAPRRGVHAVRRAKHPAT